MTIDLTELLECPEIAKVETFSCNDGVVEVLIAFPMYSGYGITKKGDYSARNKTVMIHFAYQQEGNGATQAAQGLLQPRQADADARQTPELTSVRLRVPEDTSRIVLGEDYQMVSGQLVQGGSEYLLTWAFHKLIPITLEHNPRRLERFLMGNVHPAGQTIFMLKPPGPNGNGSTRTVAEVTYLPREVPAHYITEVF